MTDKPIRLALAFLAAPIAAALCAATVSEIWGLVTDRSETSLSHVIYTWHWTTGIYPSGPRHLALPRNRLLSRRETFSHLFFVRPRIGHRGLRRVFLFCLAGDEARRATVVCARYRTAIGVGHHSTMRGSSGCILAHSSPRPRSAGATFDLLMKRASTWA